jgi:hypothetical protein
MLQPDRTDPELACDVPTTKPAGQPSSRTGRALVGWLDEASGVALLAGTMPSTGEAEVRCARARAAVQSRQLDPAAYAARRSEPTEDLQRHVAHLQAEGAAAAYWAEGYRLGVVDLRCVIPIQPCIFIDPNAPIDQPPNGMPAVADISLPRRVPQNLPCNFDGGSKTFTVQSSNPNLRITGMANGVDPVRGHAFTFFFDSPPSYMQVVLVGGRALLRDGHHRALQLLRSGVYDVPVLVREFPVDLAGLASVPTFPSTILLGDNPPLLADFLDDDLAVNVALPAIRKTVIFQGLELNVAA